MVFFINFKKCIVTSIALQRCYVLNKKAYFFPKDKIGFFEAVDILGVFEIVKGTPQYFYKIFLLYVKIKIIFQNVLFSQTILYLQHETYFLTKLNILL
jgi:hypothetical protein